jgi:hypothetical protein
MTVRPADLNKTIAWLFIIGSALFALGSVPGYMNAVGATADSVTVLRWLALLHRGFVRAAPASPDTGNDRG